MKSFLVVENVLHHFKKSYDLLDPTTRLGDIFLSDDGFSFVSYTEFHLASSLMQGVSSLMLG